MRTPLATPCPAPEDADYEAHSTDQAAEDGCAVGRRRSAAPSTVFALESTPFPPTPTGSDSDDNQIETISLYFPRIATNEKGSPFQGTPATQHVACLFCYPWKLL